MSIRHFHKRDRINNKKTRKAQQWPLVCHLTAFSRVSFILGVALDIPHLPGNRALLPLLTCSCLPFFLLSPFGWLLLDWWAVLKSHSSRLCCSFFSHFLSKFSFCLITSAWTSNQATPVFVIHDLLRRASCTSDMSTGCLVVLSNSVHLKVNSASSPSAPSDWLY